MADWKIKTGKADGFLEFGHKSRVYKDDKLMGEALGNSPKEARDRAIDRAIKKATEKKK